jgi:L-asparaginase
MTKNITILATGGTIAGAGATANQANYSPSAISAQDLIKTVTGIEKLANITCEQILSIGSQNITDANWLEIAQRANHLLNTTNVDGIVITHGTDTLEETAYFLNLTIKSTKPVILVGAMRPSTSIGCDGPINLYNAVALAADKQAENKGVLVVMADNIFAARDVAKTGASSVEAFSAHNSGKIGHISYGNAKIYYQPTKLHTKNTEFDVSKNNILPKVEIVQIYAGFDANIIDSFITDDIKAIVVAGVGGGNVGKDALPKLIKARQKGIFIVRSSRVGSGFILPNMEINDDEFGFITADNLSPQKARILTKLAILQTENLDKIKEIFNKY